MILGVGFDLEDLEDFGRTMDQSGEAFLNRVFTEREVEYCRSQPHARQSYAARYCAKEAAMKALAESPEWKDSKWRDFEIICASSGAPPASRDRSRGLGCQIATRTSILRFSVHSRSAAGAVVVAEGAGSIPGVR